MDTGNEAATGNDINGKESSNFTDEYKTNATYRIEKFDKKKFLTILILGIVSSIIGVSVISSSMNVSQKLAPSQGIHIFRNLVSESPRELLVFLGGNLLLLLGVCCIFLGLKIVVRYIASQLKD